MEHAYQENYAQKACARGLGYTLSRLNDWQIDFIAFLFGHKIFGGDST